MFNGDNATMETRGINIDNSNATPIQNGHISAMGYPPEEGNVPRVMEQALHHGQPGQGSSATFVAQSSSSVDGGSSEAKNHIEQSTKSKPKVPEGIAKYS